MKRFLKWAAMLLVVAIIGIGVWGYAPDTDPAAMRAKYANAASQFVDLGNGLKVHVRDEGKRDGPVIMLIHGSNASLQTWEPWVKRLGDRYRVISFDQLGHGLTGPNPAEAYDEKAYVGSVEALANKLGLPRFTLVGNSMGGWVAWNYALAHPERLDALVLVAAGGAPDSDPPALPIGYRIARMPVLGTLTRSFTPRSIIEKSVRQTLAVQAPINDAMIDRYWELLRYPGNRAAMAERFAVTRVVPTKAQFAKLTIPTLVMWGDKDGLVPVSAADWFASAIPGARKIIYPGIGHIPMEEIPERSADDLAEFLAETVDDDVTGK